MNLTPEEQKQLDDLDNALQACSENLKTQLGDAYGDMCNAINTLRGA